MKSVLHSWLMVLLCIGWAACSQSDETLVQENVPVQVGLTLSTGAGYGSRAAHENAELEPGTGYENFIDVVGRDFRFYIFDKDNKFVDELKTLMVVPIDNSEYPSTYYLTAELNEIPPANEEFKVVAIASWDNYPSGLKVGETTIEDICEASMYVYKHNEDDPFIPSKTHKIPMYGVMTHQPVEFKPNLSTDLGEINMLRAMAKVEVKLELADGSTNFELESVKLHNFTENGMAAPHGVYDNTGGNCSATLDELHMDHDYTVNTNPIDFPVGEGNSRIIYIPEYKNVDFHTPSYITVTLKHGDHTKDYPIYFRNYQNGKPKDGEQIDIVRNHHYQFVITKVGAGIEVTYVVADWEYEEDSHIWEQEFEYPSYENLVPWKYVLDGNTTQTITENFAKMKYNSANWEEDENGEDVLKAPDGIQDAFEVGFRMTAPEGQLWTPAVSSTDYIVRVYKWTDGRFSEVLEEKDYVADDCWYMIQLIPTESITEDLPVTLGITVKLDWMGVGSLYLLINGQGDETIWPNNDDARLINLIQEADDVSGSGN